VEDASRGGGRYAKEGGPEVEGNVDARSTGDIDGGQLEEDIACRTWCNRSDKKGGGAWCLTAYF